jgi:hypothetical protein
MPAIRPEAISNLIRLAYEARAAMARFVPEDRAVDPVLAAVIDEDSPDEEGISSFGSEHNLFSGPDELVFGSLAPIGISIS